MSLLVVIRPRQTVHRSVGADVSRRRKQKALRSVVSPSKLGLTSKMSFFFSIHSLSLSRISRNPFYNSQILDNPTTNSPIHSFYSIHSFITTNFFRKRGKLIKNLCIFAQNLYTAMKTTASIASMASIKIMKSLNLLSVWHPPPSVPLTLPGVECIPPRLGAWLSRPRQPSRARYPKTVEKIPPHSTKQLKTDN